MVESATQKDRVLDLLKTYGESVSRANLLSELDMSESRLDNLLSEMVDEGLLRKPSRGLYTIRSSSDTSERLQKEAPTEDLTGLFSDDISIDVYTDIRVEAGDGRVAYPDEARKKVTIPRQFISKIIGFVPPKKVGMMMVDGDSMHPTIQEDDMVLWRPVEELNGNGIYVLSIDGRLKVKRVQTIPGGGLELISDNDYHGYKNYTLTPQDGHLVNEATGSPVVLQEVGKVIFPRRDTDRMHVKQVAEIVKSVAGGEVDLGGM